MIHPVVLSKGYRFFDEKTPFAEFKLTEVVTGDTGIMAAMYQQEYPVYSLSRSTISQNEGRILANTDLIPSRLT